MTREEKLAARRAWYAKNKERLKTYFRAYYEANKEKVKGDVKEWRKKNPAKRNRYKRKWAKKNPNKMRLYWRRSQQKKRAAEALAALEASKASIRTLPKIKALVALAEAKAIPAKYGIERIAYT
jgi:hypothetical protein